MSDVKDATGLDRGDNFSETTPAASRRVVVVTSAVVAAFVAAAGTLAIEAALGHLRPDGAPTAVVRDGLTEFEGQVNGASEGEVYYPASFAAPPNLSIEGGSPQLQVLEQRKDGFKYHTPLLNANFTWKAKGVRAGRF
jgi:hypothetical protein